MATPRVASDALDGAGAAGDGTGSDDASSGARADEPIDISSKFKHARDDEPPPPLPVDPPLASYWRDLAEQVHSTWHLPPAGTREHQAVGCFHISPDGKIVEVKLHGSSGDATIDASVEHALAEVQRARNEHLVIVPTDQLLIIKSWVCLRFKV